MIGRFQIFLGPRRFKAFLALLGITGLASLALGFIADQAWATTAQTILLLVFIVGAAYLILGRLPREERLRWLAIIVPAVLAIFIASLVFPHLTGLFVGAGIGWIVAGIFVFNSGGASRHYRRAIKAMRKGDHANAISEMNAQIKQQPDLAEHYRFRAELHRLAGNLHLARRDYRRMIELDDQQAVAYNGLAEVELQARNFEQALEAAQKAYELAPDEWVAAYNLGMIEDRLGDSANAVRHLQSALESKIPDSRHRLLVQLYLLRANARLGDEIKAQEALEAIKREKAGLEEWQVIMRADEAAALREVLQDDIELARALLGGEKQLSALMAEAL